MIDLESLLLDRFASAFATVADGPADPALRRSQHADFQADGALALARRLGRNPREVAAEVLAAADLADLATAELAGPGFINVTLHDDAITRLLGHVHADQRLGVPTAELPQ